MVIPRFDSAARAAIRLIADRGMAMDYRLIFKRETVVANAWDKEMATRIAKEYRAMFPEVGRLKLVKLAD